MPATLHLAHGGWVACETTDFAMGGLGLELKVPVASLNLGDRLRVTLQADDGAHDFPVRVATVRDDHIGLLLADLSIAQQRAYVRCTFGARDAWRDWDSGITEDRPLASFAEVFSFGATGYVRLLQSLYNRAIDWRRNTQLASAS
jgi:cellulose synthase (UDP-forming)